MEFLRLAVTGIIYAILIAILAPALILFRIDERGAEADDGIDIGYDDNDPGEPLDE